LSAWCDTHRIFSGNSTFDPVTSLHPHHRLPLSLSLCLSRSLSLCAGSEFLAGSEVAASPASVCRRTSMLEVHSALTFDSEHFVLRVFRSPVVCHPLANSQFPKVPQLFCVFPRVMQINKGKRIENRKPYRNVRKLERAKGRDVQLPLLFSHPRNITRKLGENNLFGLCERECWVNVWSSSSSPASSSSHTLCSKLISMSFLTIPSFCHSR